VSRDVVFYENVFCWANTCDDNIVTLGNFHSQTQDHDDIHAHYCPSAAQLHGSIPLLHPTHGSHSVLDTPNGPEDEYDLQDLQLSSTSA